MIFRLSILLGFIFFFISCQEPTEFKATTFQASNPDFSYLKDALKGKRIVALGESSHGFGDLQLLKSSMIQYMHEELGYDVFMMEAGYGDVNLAWEYIDDSDAKQLRNGSLFGNFRSEQMLPLFEYLKSKSTTKDRLEYAGYDSQISSEAFNYKLMYIIDRIEPRIIQDSVKTGIKAYYDMYQYRDSLEAWTYYKNKLYAGVALAESILDDNMEDIRERELANEKEIAYIRRTLQLLEKSVDYPFGEAYTTGLNIRDSLMAANVIQMAENEFAGKKIILWGHNGHIESAPGKGYNSIWMGHRLKKHFGDDYYAMGMFAKKGTFYTHWNRKNNRFDISEDGFLENMLAQNYTDDVFIQLPPYDANSAEWYHNYTKSFEPESGGVAEYIPSQRFDGLLIIQHTEAPELILTRD